MDTRRLMKELPVELTASERAAKQDGVLDHLDAIEDLEEEKKESAKSYADDIKAEKAAMAKLRKQLGSNSEKRNVECEEQSDFRTQTVITIRLDTGAVISERTMSADELQTELDTSTEPEGIDTAGETVEETWSEPSNVVAMSGGAPEPSPPARPSSPDDPSSE